MALSEVTFALTAQGLAGFALTALLIELTPGPNMVYLAILALGEGRRSGYAAVVGVALGLALVGAAAALGLAAAIDASPLLYATLRWAGAAYLLWLAWDAWRDAGEKVEGPVEGPPLRFLLRGFTTNVLNPKAAIFYVAILPTFVVPAAPILPQTLVLSAVYVGIATLIHTIIVTLAATLRPFIEDPDRSRIVRRVLAVGLALVALWFIWKTAG